MVQTYPGVYVEEVPSQVRTIAGVATSLTAFVGRARKGPINTPVIVTSFGDFQRMFGGLWDLSRLSFAVHHYFLNGGQSAIIVRVTRGVSPEASSAQFSLAGPGGALELEASSPGTWGNNLKVTANHDTAPAPDPAAGAALFNLVIEDPAPAGTGETETIRNLSRDHASARFVTAVLEQESHFVRVRAGTTMPGQRPNPGVATEVAGSDGGEVRDADLVPATPNKQGIYALDDADIFNILCLPPLSLTDEVDPGTWAKAAQYCWENRAMLLVDPPSPSNAVVNATTFLGGLGAIGGNKKNAALFFPRLRMPNPVKNNLVEDFAPCGAVAGVFARTDAQRGVWKAPAGQDAGLNGVQALTYQLSDEENGQLNPLGINCLRSFPLVGPVVWGSRTLDGADSLASEWKYLPVRRLALYIEESLFRGTKWVVFEGNDESLWAQIRLNVGAFMHDLFRQGAFQGQTPQEAYFVKCDSETTTQSDINQGIVNILVGFAPLKPAEFVVIKIQQMAGQLEA